ncbi:tRNA epoxyqueuosine(34) reductase QueG [Bowmanella pacifica]|uniref:Epoxyqueuosine reductase n=1 Tax=Bowmanella pacifica TaxID=502051 RepID=A0A918DK81_9ALTE|nr:tRNA epoxyqueuosine(34) reductase QueG [Bowmanella pacifica]GGO71453.1 epoxyqueuosine reductase [Bowmanella pacifica]
MAELCEKVLMDLTEHIKSWGRALGFQQVGICDVDLSRHEARLQDWLDKGMHGEMQFMAEHGMKRARPDELLPGTLRVISVRMDYLPPDAGFARNLKDRQQAYISRYALGRDYHKLLRQRLKKLGEMIQQRITEFDLSYRPFVDSAPVLEHAVAEKAGLGWTGKHSLTINRQAGSWFFLGELFINLPLPVDKPVEEGCGSCTACLTICPTGAIVEPYVVDARRCISYLTIEQKGAIPEEFRPLLGNRIYGCDDCQLVCPWNRYAQITDEADFHPRQQLQGKDLLELFGWSEATFLKNTEGSPIRRIGHERWLRNIAVGLGNAPYSSDIVAALQAQREACTEMVKEHIDWALAQQAEKKPGQPDRQTLRLIRSVQKGLPRDA